MQRFTPQTQHPMNQVDLIAKLADLQEQNYRTTLALTAVLELLTEKGILTEQEIRTKAAELDALELKPLEANPTW